MNKAILFASAACMSLGASIQAKVDYYDLAAIDAKAATTNTVKNIARGATRSFVSWIGSFTGFAMGFYPFFPEKQQNPLLPAFIAMSAGILTFAYDKLERKLMVRRDRPINKKDTWSSNTVCYARSILTGLTLGSSWGLTGRLLGYIQ